MVIAIPSLSNGQGVARTSREGDRDEHAASTAARSPSGTGRALSQARSRPTSTHRTSVHPTSQTGPRATRNVATTTTTMVDPRTSATTYSLGNLCAQLPAELALGSVVRHAYEGFRGPLSPGLDTVHREEKDGAVIHT